jgi:CubicO group peptidase (beta-lactamase class C family)
MRISLPAAAIVLLFLSPDTSAGDVKYKSRQQPDVQDRQTRYKGADTSRERPPDKYRPIKEPPQPRQPDEPPDTYRPQPPPAFWPHDPGCMPVFDEPVFTPMPFPDSPPPSELVVFRDMLSRRLRLMETEGFAGQVVVGWEGHVYFQRSYGGRGLFHPAAVNGYYDIGSATKAFTAWAIYRLVDSRKLTLPTTLGELFANVPPDKRRVTVEQLLGNTSGLGNTYAADGETDRDAAVGKLLAQPLAHAPGQVFLDSDDGYVLLAAIIDVTSGMAYESYMFDSEVVGPAMKHTLFWGSVGSQDEHWGERGSRGIISTAHDLHAFASAFVSDRPFIVEEITRTRQVREDGVGVGYGWFWTEAAAGDPILWTSGTGQLDNNVMLVVYPGGAILAVASDRFHGDVPWSERVANSLEPLLLHAGPPSDWLPFENTSQIRPTRADWRRTDRLY